MFQNIHGKFDIIASNPPIMPMEHITTENVHDSGGNDGRLYLTTIIQNALNYLNNDGYLLLSAFSFLGTDTETNNQISLKEYAMQTGYKSFEIVKKVIKSLAKGSVTYKQLPYIRKTYPKMLTLEYNGHPAVEFQILRIKKYALGAIVLLARNKRHYASKTHRFRCSSLCSLTLERSDKASPCAFSSLT